MLDQLFWKFADKYFVYRGNYPYYTELVFAFADYIEKLDDSELAELLPEQSPPHIRKIIRIGIDKWLKSHAKTMLIL